MWCQCSPLFSVIGCCGIVGGFYLTFRWSCHTKVGPLIFSSCAVSFAMENREDCFNWWYSATYDVMSGIVFGWSIHVNVWCFSPVGWSSSGKRLIKSCIHSDRSTLYICWLVEGLVKSGLENCMKWDLCDSRVLELFSIGFPSFYLYLSLFCAHWLNQSLQDFKVYQFLVEASFGSP